MSASKYAVETVADYGDLCGECPLWHGETQTLYWTDIAGKRLCRCTWPERHHQIIHEQFGDQRNRAQYRFALSSL